MTNTPLRFSSLSINLKHNFGSIDEENLQSITIATKSKPRCASPRNRQEKVYWVNNTLGDVWINTRLVGSSPKLRKALERQDVPENDPGKLRQFIIDVLDDVEDLPEREQQTWFGNQSLPAYQKFCQDLAKPLKTYLQTVIPKAEHRVRDSISIFFEPKG